MTPRTTTSQRLDRARGLALLLVALFAVPAVAVAQSPPPVDAPSPTGSDPPKSEAGVETPSAEELEAIAGRVAAGQVPPAELSQHGAVAIDPIRDHFEEGSVARERLLTAVVRAELLRIERADRTLQYQGQYLGLLPIASIARPELLRIFQDEDESIALRTRAARALGDLEAKEVLPILRRMLDDFLAEEWTVREAEALAARLGDRSFIDARIAEQRAVLETTLSPSTLSFHLAAHEELSELYYRVGDYAKSIEHYELKLAILDDLSRTADERLRPSLEAEMKGLHYNLACALALAERYEDALAALDIALGAPDITESMVLRDGDLGGLRRNEAFAEWWRKRKGGDAPKK